MLNLLNTNLRRGMPRQKLGKVRRQSERVLKRRLRRRGRGAVVLIFRGHPFHEVAEDELGLGEGKHGVGQMVEDGGSGGGGALGEGLKGRSLGSEVRGCR
jgi:hypothetical protein